MYQTLAEGLLMHRCAVSVDGEALVMEVFENEVEVIPYVEHGEMLVLWQLHREGLGNAVTITTGKPLPWFWLGFWLPAFGFWWFWQFPVRTTS